MKRQRLAVLGTSFLALTACGSDIDRLVISEAPASQYQGELLSAITVRAFDKDGKLVSGDTVQVTASEGELGGTTAIALRGGIATFSDLHVDTAVAGVMLTAKANGKSVTSAPFDVTGVRLRLSAPPPGLLSGDPFTATATFQDVQSGATVPIARDVTLSVTNSTLTGAGTQTSVSGTVTFANVFVASGGVGITLTAAAPACDPATTGPFEVTQLVLAFSGVGENGVPDTLGPYGVRLTDGTRSILQDVQRTVTLAGTPAIGGTTAVTTSSGVAMFDDLFVVASGSVSMTASAAGVAPITATVRLSFSSAEREVPDKNTVTNDSSATAELVSPGVPVFGSLHTPGDIDYYRFHALAGQKLEVASYGVRMDQAAFGGGTEIGLWVSDGETRMQLMSSAALERTGLDDGVQDVLIPADGDYYVSIAVERGAPGGSYALEVWLRDVDVIRAPESVVEGTPWEVEPNSATISADAPAEMNAIANTGRIAGVIDPAGDHDNFSFSAHAGQLVSIDLHGGPGRSDGERSLSISGSTLVPTLAIVDASGTMLASTTTAPRPPFAKSLNRPLAMLSIAFRAPADATYYVVVSDKRGSGGEDHAYWLQLRRNQ